MCRLWENVEEYSTANRPQLTMLSMRIACWIPKATNTHSEYVRLLFYSNNRCTNTPQCYVKRTVPVLSALVRVCACVCVCARARVCVCVCVCNRRRYVTTVQTCQRSMHFLCSVKQPLKFSALRHFWTDMRSAISKFNERYLSSRLTCCIFVAASLLI